MFFRQIIDLQHALSMELACNSSVRQTSGYDMDTAGRLLLLLGTAGRSSMVRLPVETDKTWLGVGKAVWRHIRRSEVGGGFQGCISHLVTAFVRQLEGYSSGLDPRRTQG